MDLACSKWCLNECRFPWHLGLKADYICSTLEPAMRKLGLAEGMASYRADGAGSWAGGEAPHVAELRERCAQAGSTVQELSQDLHSLVEVDRTMSEPAKVVQATALLRLGAQVNYAPLVLNGWGPLHSALDQSMAELGKCLIEHKADLQQLYRSDGVDYTPFQYCKKQTWLTITSFCAHRLVDEDEELRKRLGLAAPPASSLAPGSVVEVLAGDGRGELAMILDEPVPGMHRIAGRSPVKRAAELRLRTDLGELAEVGAFKIATWSWPEGAPSCFDPRGIYVRSPVQEEAFGTKLYVNVLGGFVLYKESAGSGWAITTELQLRLPVAQSSLTTGAGFFYGGAPADGVEFSGFNGTASISSLT